MNPNQRPHPAFLALICGILALLGSVATAATGSFGDEVTVSVKAQKAHVIPGDQLAIAIIFDHKEGWHIHTHTPVPPPGIPEGMLIATRIDPQPSEHLGFWRIQWPRSKAVNVDLAGTGRPSPYHVYGGRAIAYLPVQISPDAQPGSELQLTLEIEYQACDDTSCLMPEELVETLTFRVVSPEEAATLPITEPSPDFAGFDATIFDSPQTGPGEPASPRAPPEAAPGIDLGAFNLRLNVDPTSLLGTIALMAVGFVGGFLLNLTPCVLPVIPIKIMGLSQAAGNPARCFLLGLVMSLGVLAFWLAVGVAIAVLAVLGSAAELFGVWWFTLLLGLFIGIMGLGMMGLFTVQLPQSVYKVSPRHDTLGGSFLFGIMTAVLGLPCFAPFMGGATGVALAVSPAVALLTFGAIGAGMALPYLVLSARPQWINIIPRTGPASELIKQVMGILLLAAAAFFVGSGLQAILPDMGWIGRSVHWWAVAAFLALGGLWLAIRTFQITRSAGRRVLFGGMGITVAAAGLALGLLVTALYRDAGVWQRYTHEAFAEAAHSGKVVVVDFTAEWCLNCHALKLSVLNRSQVRRELRSEQVVALTADLTRRSDPGWEKLHELGERGIPLLAIFGPGTDEPFKSNAYTVDQVVSAIQRARGTPPGTLSAGTLAAEADAATAPPPR